VNFLIIEGDFPFWRGFIVEEWRRLPHRTLLLSVCPKLWRPGDTDALESLPISGASLDAAALRRTVASWAPLAGACTLFEPAVGRTLEIQRLLGLPPLSRGEPRALRNKGAMVEVMAGAGLAVPDTAYGTKAEPVVREALARLRFPLIVKPSELAGKAGVKLCHDEAELRRAVDAALQETLPFEIDGRMTSVVEIFDCERGVLVQEYVDGPEYSVEGWASRGEVVVLAITEKLHSGPPLFEELGHLQPARLAAADERAITDYAVACVRDAFQLVHCAFHLEVRLARRGPVMMEINCRIAGDMIGRLLEMRSSMNVGEALLRLAAGERVAAPPRFVGAAGVRMATTPRGGVLRRIHAPVLRGDREVAVFEPGPGDPVHAPKPGGVTRVGYFLASGPDPDAVLARLDALAHETTVDLDPAPA
jgi:cysteine synthase A